jgi:hypothetical protein
MKSVVEKWTFAVETLFDENQISSLDLTQRLDTTSESFEASPIPPHLATLLNSNEILDHDHIPQLVLSALKNYYDLAFLFESYRGGSTWYLSQLAVRGQIIPLRLHDQFAVRGFIPKYISPLDIQSAPTEKVLQFLKIKNIPFGSDDLSFLLKPTPHAAFVLSTATPFLWASTQIDCTQALVNNAFSY